MDSKNQSMDEILNTLKDFRLNEEGGVYYGLKKREHPNVKIYENKAKTFLAKNNYSKAYKLLHKVKKYRKIDYKPVVLIDETHLFFK